MFRFSGWFAYSFLCSSNSIFLHSDLNLSGLKISFVFALIKRYMNFDEISFLCGELIINS